MYLSEAFYKLQKRQDGLQRSADRAGINVDPSVSFELNELNEVIAIVQKFMDGDVSLTTSEWTDAFNTMADQLGIEEEIILDEEYQDARD